MLLFGSQESKYYPFRSRLSKLFGNTNGINFKLVRPSGKYWGKKLSELINQSWLTVSTTSVYDYLVCKYFEISASNSVVLGNLDNIGKTIWNNSDYINIEPNMSDSQIVKIVKKSLDDKNNLLKIGERMGKKIRDNFSTESYVTKLVEIIRRR